MAEDIKYYIVDTETTGLTPGYHEITQISIIRCSDRKQLNRYIKAQYPKRVNPVALEKTDRTYSDLFKGDSRGEVVEFCNNFFNEDGTDPEERCIIGHNIIKFDKGFLHELWGGEGLEFPACLWLDTMSYIGAWKKMKGLTTRKSNLNWSLEALGITPRPGGHNAVIDTQNNYILWDQLKKKNLPALPHMKRFAHKLNKDD